MLAGPRRFLPFLLALFLLAACGGAPAAQPTAAAPVPTEAPVPTAAAAAPTSAPAAPAAVGYPVTVENCGRTLTFDQAPERVFTGYQPVFELMAGLGLGDRIAFRLAWPESSLTPFLPGQKEIYDRAQEVSDSISLPQREAAVSLGADFVISEGYYNFNAERGYATIEEFAQNGTQVYIVGGWCSKEQQDDYTLDVLYQDIRNLGQIFAVPDQAEALIAEMQASVADAEERVRGLPKLNVYAYDSGEGPLYSYGGGMMQQTISRAGGENLFKDEAWFFEANIEAVAATNPDAFVIVDYPPTTAEEKVEFLCTRVVPESNACKERRYVAIPAVAFHPGYRNPFAVAEIARVLHPEAFEGAAAAPATAARTQYPVTIENCGQQLTIPSRPERVIVSWGGQAAYLLALGVEESIVGMYYRFPDEENRLVQPEMKAGYLAIPVIGGSDGTPPGREVPINLTPDFFYSDNPSDFADGRATREDFAAAGATVFSSVYGCTDPAQQTLELMFEEIRILGVIFDAQAEAEALVARLQRELAAVEAKVEGLAPVRALLLEGSAETLYTAGNGLVTDIFARAGAENIFDGASYDAPPSREVLATSAPDVVIVWDTNVPDLRPIAREVFATAPAVANDRIVQVRYIGGIGLRAPEFAEALARAFHPEAFE